MKKLVVVIFLLLFNIGIVNAKQKVEFSSCVDGDTVKIILKNKVETLRLLAVDTPESVHPKKQVEYYGKEASNYTCETIKNAKKIEIEYDKNSEKKDKYDRLLVWLFIDDKLFQEQLIENGYAKVAYLYGDYKYTESLQEKEKIAKTKKIGIWNEEEKNNYNSSNNIVENVANDIKKDQEENSLTFKEIVFILLLLIILSLVGNNKTMKKTMKTLKKLSK